MSSSTNSNSSTRKSRNQGNGKTDTGRPRRRQNNGGLKFTKYDLDKQERFDASIEQELNQGNFKMRGRKTKVSIDHLLDFQLPEVQRENHTHRKVNKRRIDSHTYLHGESFINVNYRLLVSDRYDYKDQENDPNKFVDKEKIVRVIVPRGQNCPICLNEIPVAPRMVTCGHIFCMSCLENFFEIEEVVKNPETGIKQKKKFKECPLCGSIVKPNNVKEVLFEEDYSFNKQAFQEGSDHRPEPGHEASLVLMCKPHGSILALPISLDIDPKKVGDIPPANIEEISEYSHIMKCGDDYALKYYQLDMDAIENQYEIDKALYSDSGKYVKVALDKIRQNISTILSKDDFNSSINHITEDFMNKLHFDGNQSYDDTSAYFFYQTNFQSPIKYYLSPLDIKILLTIFGHYSKFPELLEVKIENIHYGNIVTEALIKRYKYLGHLPYGTEIALLDLDWRSVPFIEKDVYNRFASELKQRRRKLIIRKQREDQEKKKYEERLEQEQREFYQRENSNFTGWEPQINKKDIQLTSLPAPVKPPQNTEAKLSKYNEKTIWGTSIEITEDEKTTKENKEFEDMLLQKMRQEKSNKKKKGKIMLFSNTQQHL